MLTHEDINNILALINAAPIKGVEAEVVAQLKVKLSNYLNPSKEELKQDNDTGGKSK